MSSTDRINWIEDIEEAKRAAAFSEKPILTFFHSVRCNGCIKTIEGTLPKMSVIDSINEKYIPLMLDVDKNRDMVAEYRVDWTPTFIVTDAGGAETMRWVGYLPEDDYLGQLDMALAFHSFKKGDYKNAERNFDQVVLKYPLTDLAPEACYYIGVSRYRATNDPAWLTKAYVDLKEMYPESVWALKASAWSAESMAKAA